MALTHEQRLARVLLKQDGHLGVFEVEFHDGILDRVVGAFEELGCKVVRVPGRVARVRVDCTGVDPSLLANGVDLA
ncbi:MAG TPA: hypothetical protein VM328_03465 [Fimbriimonadaceae bacterium]|nr:hypothetical protein [Fimbriimonadaceae bacterium]